jgi:arylsulfatase A-like enzyme
VQYRHVDHITPGKHSSELFADATIEFLSSHQDTDPFFAYVSFMAPHDPRTMPEQFLRMYDPDEVRLPANFMPEHPFDNGELVVRDELLADFPRTPEEIRRHNAEYYAMISHLDAQIGRILAVLDHRGWTENTIIVLAGDNGLAIGRHGLMGKQNLYDHSLHVPLLMCGPGIPSGAIRDNYAYLLDIYPTLCDLIDVPIPGSVEGRSLLPSLRDASQWPRESLLFAYRGYQRAAQDRTHKLVEYAVDGNRVTQLFDLAADPWELNSVADEPEMAPKVAQLRDILKGWRDQLGDTQDRQGADFWTAFEG